MEKKNFNQTQRSIVKRVAMNVNSSVEKIAKLNEKIDALVAERESLQAIVDSMEAPIITMTGYRSTDLFEKVVVPKFNVDGSPVIDEKTGKPMKNTVYRQKYETFVPEVAETIENTTEEAVAETQNNTEAVVETNDSINNTWE